MSNKELYNYDYELTYSQYDDEDLGDTYYRRDILNIFNVDFNNNMTYNYIDCDSDNKGVTDNDKKKELSDEDLFKLDLFHIIGEKAGQIYEILPKDNELFNSLCIESSGRLFSCDMVTGFMMLFSFQTLEIQHELLQYFFKNGSFNNELLVKFREKLQNI